MTMTSVLLLTLSLLMSAPLASSCGGGGGQLTLMDDQQLVLTSKQIEQGAAIEIPVPVTNTGDLVLAGFSLPLGGSAGDELPLTFELLEQNNTSVPARTPLLEPTSIGLGQNHSVEDLPVGDYVVRVSAPAARGPVVAHIDIRETNVEVFVSYRCSDPAGPDVAPGFDFPLGIVALLLPLALLARRGRAQP